MELDETTIAYIRQANEFALLTVQREKELAKIIRSYKTGKMRQKAIHELISHNLKLVIKEAFRYAKKTGLEFKDFIGSGNEGLIKAAEKFNPQKFKTKFSTYATYWIREAMQDHTYKNMSVVTVPVHISNGVAKHKKIMERGVAMTDKQLRKELSVSESGLQRIKGAHISSVSLQQTVNHGGDGDEITIGDTLPDENAIDPSENSSSNDDFDFLYEALEELDETSKNIVMAQFLQGDKAKLGKLGKRFSVTGERIRQIRESALKMLRKKIEIKRKHGRNGHNVMKVVQ